MIDDNMPHYREIKNLCLSRVSYDNLESYCPTATFSPITYNALSPVTAQLSECLIKGFPMIFRGDGTPWEIGNLYLIVLYDMRASGGNESMGTLKNTAVALVDYLRFIERLRQKNAKYNEYHFPADHHDRITYLYRRFLETRKTLHNHPDALKDTTAASYMNYVINFYRRSLEFGLISQSKLEHTPFVETALNVRFIDSIGRPFVKAKSTTDLTMKVRKSSGEPGTVHDDGSKLRPMSHEDLNTLIETLEKFNNRKLQLFFWFALYTGARLQTVTTLRIGNLRQSLKNSPPRNPSIWLKVGPGTNIDTKNDVQYRLTIPRILAQQLLDYADSPNARKLQEKSFYGISDENYVFLTPQSVSYYTSKREILDRKMNKDLDRVPLESPRKFQPNKGGAITKYVNRLNAACIESDPDFFAFRFHDLRATFAMNYLDSNYRNGTVKGDKVLHELRELMGHANISTTMRYLDFRSSHEKHRELTKKVSDRLYKYEEDELESCQKK